MSAIGVFGFSPMYCSARSMPSRRTGSFSLSGSGTRSSIGTTISGDVPQVTCGRKLRRIDVDHQVEARPRVTAQRAPVGDRLVPVGAGRRHRTARAGSSSVMSSTAIMPERAPASIAMLQIVIRPSIDSARIAEPPNSMA